MLIVQNKYKWEIWEGGVVVSKPDMNSVRDAKWAHSTPRRHGGRDDPLRVDIDDGFFCVRAGRQVMRQAFELLHWTRFQKQKPNGRMGNDMRGEQCE